MSIKFNYDKDLPKPSQLKLEYLRNQVTILKAIKQPEQKSTEWYEMRKTMLSASNWGEIIEKNPDESLINVLSKWKSILLDKCGESKFLSNSAIDWGNKYEDVAVSVYEYRNKVNIIEFGSLRHPYIPYLGASPDGITADGIMLEIKCPYSRQISGIPLYKYWCQVQGQLEVCDLDRCDFLECTFKEYDNEEEYLNDYYDNNGVPIYYLNNYGYEKGSIIQFYRKNNKTFYYKYSPVNIIGNELEKWKMDTISNETSDNVIYSQIYYWYLKETSCIPIYRNQEWFHSNKHVFEVFWNTVLKYRELGIDALKRDVETEKMELNKNKSDKSESKKQRSMNEYINLNDVSKSEDKSDNTYIVRDFS